MKKNARKRFWWEVTIYLTFYAEAHDNVPAYSVSGKTVIERVSAYTAY